MASTVTRASTSAAGPCCRGCSTATSTWRADDFVVALRDPSGEYRSFDRTPGVAVTIHDPLARHHELLDRYTDADMHNLTAYLATLK